MDTTLHRIDPARNAFRFYRLALWPDLFGGVSLAREWGRLGQPGKLRLDPFGPVPNSRVTSRHLTMRSTPEAFLGARFS